MKITLQNVNTNKLHDELIVSGIVPLLVESLENTTWITFEDNTDMDLVQQIIDAHDPTPLPPQPTEFDKIRIESAQANAELFEMMLSMLGGI